MEKYHSLKNKINIYHFFSCLNLSIDLHSFIMEQLVAPSPFLAWIIRLKKKKKQPLLIRNPSKGAVGIFWRCWDYYIVCWQLCIDCTWQLWIVESHYNWRWQQSIEQYLWWRPWISRGRDRRGNDNGRATHNNSRHAWMWYWISVSCTAYK